MLCYSTLWFSYLQSLKLVKYLSVRDMACFWILSILFLLLLVVEKNKIMPAPKDNEYYRLRKFDGRPKQFTPDGFLKACYGYFKWCTGNPVITQDFIKSGDRAGEIVKMEISRPYSIEGLCVHIGIVSDTFQNYSKAAGYEGFFAICAHVREIIRQNQITGGMAGVYNASLTARINGLAEKNVNENFNTERPILSIDPIETDQGTTEDSGTEQED